MVDAPQGQAGATQSGQARSMSDLTPEELLASPPFPIRHAAFVNRFPVPVEEYESLKVAARTTVQTPFGPDGAPDVQEDIESPDQPFEGNPPEDGHRTGALEGAQAPIGQVNFEGVPQTAFRPPDCTLAVGPNDVMTAVNVDLVGYTRAGAQRFRWANFTALFSPVLPQGAQLFDPKLAYDHYADRWIVCIAGRRATPQGSWILMAVSQTPDPAGPYWIWATDATFDGGTASNNWSDYPMIGFDTRGIYVSTNQFGFGGGFSYAKVRIFNKAELYAGGVGAGHNIRWWDFWNLRNPDNSMAFSVQPAAHFQGLGGNPSAFLVNSLFPKGASLTLWTLANPLAMWSGGAPSLTSTSVACRAYDLPPAAVQKDGGTVRIATNDIRLLNSVFQSNGGTQRLWTAHTSAFTWPGDTEARSVVQWYEIDIPTKKVIQNNAFGASGRHYFFPVIQTDISRNAYLTFGRSAIDEYGQLRQTGRLSTDPVGQLQGSALVVAGQASYNGGRWGDYFGIARDPADPRTVWSYGEYAGSANSWRTRVTSTRF
ncbi:MAG: hypothetical protein ACOH2F_08900 [Cellulomonas sp.]